MKKAKINELFSLIDEKVIINGFVESIRIQKNALFLIIRELDSRVQIFIQKNAQNEILVQQATGLTPESTVEIIGILISNPHVKLNGYEIIPEKISTLSKAESPLPIDSSASLQDRLDWRFLDLRKFENLLIFKVQTHLEASMRENFLKNNFLEIHSPKLIGAASESGAELFTVKYFDGVAYLAQSPQFYKQMAMAAGFDRVFEIGPVFRANPSFTSRHDTEFTSIDVEISWIQSHEEIMEFEEQWIKRIVTDLKEKLGKEIEDCFGFKIEIPNTPFPRIEVSEALSIVLGLGHQPSAEYEGELDPIGEKILCDYVKKNLLSDFVFITNYPAKVRPFYHMREKSGLTKSFDLLYKGTEITTGAQREHRIDILTSQASEKNISLDSINFYLNFFRYGIPPHGGFGFGLTRFIMLLLGLKNVREVTYIYRGPNRLFP